MNEPSLSGGIRWWTASLLTLAATIVAILVWRPWDTDELREAISDIERLRGVVAVDMEHREIDGIFPARKFGPQPSVADVSVRLDASLTSDDAEVTAERAHQILVPAAHAVARDETRVRLRMTAGEPEGVNGVLLDPLEVWYAAASGADDVADAFTIWQAGARRVNVYGLEYLVDDAMAESEPGTAPDSAGIGIEAAVPADMAPLAELAAELGRSADLHVSEGSARYTGHNAVADVDAVRLAVDAASRTGVESAVFSNYTAPQLSVYATWPAESPETQQLKDWLEAHDYATKAGHPVAFSISEPGHATLTEGWVSAFAPPEPEPTSLPLPADIDAWLDDANAPACTGADLDVSYGGSDAATGARYASLLARNVSGHPCAVEGAPEITFHNADGAAQADVRLEPYRPGVIPTRLVVPPGEQILAPFHWRTKSTANDPEITTSIQVIAVPGAEPVLLDVTGRDSSPTGLDILDGAEVRLGPWVQALEGWS